MFGFLKKKLSEVVESISGKVKSKSDGQPAQAPAEGQTPIEAQRTEEPQVEIEPVAQHPEKIETVVDVRSEEAEDEEEDTEAEVIEVDFDEEKEKAPSPIEDEPEATAPGTVEKEPEAPEAPRIPERPSETTEVLPEREETAAAEPALSPVEDEAPPVRSPGTREAESEEKKSFFKRLTEKVVKTVTEKKLSRDEVLPMLESLESGLIESDVAVEVAEKVGNDLLQALTDSEIKRGKEKEVVVSAFRKSLLDILDVPKVDLGSLAKEKKPVLVAFWGFNGAGKTTSLAKTASWLKQKGYTCCFAAADTFRAGAEEQLEIHADRLGVKLVKHKYGADPAAVIFDAVEHAKAKGIDFVLADTAGRAHTNMNLMEQMKKIVRVNKPDVKILVIDSLTGNDALEQARSYGEVGVDAVIFTKVDVNEKGGAVLSVTHELKKPIVFLGMGQEYKDFQEFDAEKFVEAVLGAEQG